MNKKTLSCLIALLVTSTTAHAELVLDGASNAGNTPAIQVATTPLNTIQVYPNTPTDLAPSNQGSNQGSIQGSTAAAGRWSGATFPAQRVIASSSPTLSNASDFDVSNQYSNQASMSPAIRAAAVASPALPFITQSGSPQGNVMRAGWANGMPLSIALRQVIPTNFVVRENGIPLNKTVSWSGDREWPVVLNDFAQNNGFVAHIDWNRGEVSLAPLNAMARAPRPSMPRPSISTPSPRPVVQEAIVHDRVFTTNEPSVVQHTRVERSAVVERNVNTSRHSKDTASSERIITQTAVNTNVWVLDPAMTLRENIEAWASRMGWRVVWQGADYPIIAPATFTGEFSSPVGPVAKLISAYETSDQPLVATLTTMDRVVHVKNKYYERQEVLPSSPEEIAPELFKSGN